MDDAIDLVFVEDAVERRLVADVCLVEGEGLAGDLAHAVKALGVAVDVVVHHNHVMPAVEKFYQRMGADVTGAARDQYVHVYASFGYVHRCPGYSPAAFFSAMDARTASMSPG